MDNSDHDEWMDTSCGWSIDTTLEYDICILITLMDTSEGVMDTFVFRDAFCLRLRLFLMFACMGFQRGIVPGKGRKKFM